MLEVFGIVAMIQGFGGLIAKQVGGEGWLLMHMVPEHLQLLTGLSLGLLGLVLLLTATSRRRATSP
ncbi:hypothetical protein [Crossiella cryophila]|uniref:Putative membrane protein YfcA n=1 Tax=Crossiella cryophila TaxID=43355 RepID=A0A7W7C547_9PSEU|nr:hypothetical protein [Crossiella cryophila]MBB4674711.1 putative membrane protein YfcA [Crossiella cryophila]